MIIFQTAHYHPEAVMDFQERFLRGKDVRAMVGMSESAIWALEADGKFPKRIKLSTRASAWLLSEVQSWMADRVAASRGKP